MQMWDVVIIGGGPAGLMAAVASGQQGARTLLLEKGNKLGRKLIISGGGRCNVTNRQSIDKLIEQIPGNGRFLYSAFHTFGNEEIIRFFEGLGIRLKEEDHGRMFPVSDKASTVAAGLIDHIRRLGVQIRLQSAVRALTFDQTRCTGLTLTTGEALQTRAVVVAVGGKSVPQTGSTGDGYAWAETAGHTITELFPTEVPLIAADPWISERALQGLSLRDITQTLWGEKGRRLTIQRGDMIFTHFGLSGPASLRTSHYVSVHHLRRGTGPLRLTIDLFPDESPAQVWQHLGDLVSAEPKKAIKNLLKSQVPERMVPLMLQMAGVDGATTGANLSREKIQALATFIGAFPVTITGTRSIEEAFVTGGGVSIKEVDPRSMQSRLKEGLFFAGEVLDVHGHTGGYNITVAFSTGYLAGNSAATLALESEQGCISPAPAT